MKQYYTYIYIKSGTPIYVGKGNGKRAYAHLKGNADNLHFHNTIQKMLREGTEPIIKIINTNSEAEAFELEKFLIAEIGRRDLGRGPLLNLTDGGDQGPGAKIGNKNRLGTRQSVETVRLMSEQRRGSLHPMFGRKQTEQAKHLMSLHKKGILKWYNNGINQVMIDPTKGIPEGYSKGRGWL